MMVPKIQPIQPSNYHTILLRVRNVKDQNTKEVMTEDEKNKNVPSPM